MTVAAVVPTPTPTRARRVLEVRGAVQGVGFRPFVYRTAVALGLTGGVWNGAGGVTVDAEGDPASLDCLRDALAAAPAPARVESVEETGHGSALGALGFSIHESREDDSPPRVPADLATCDLCLAELLDPGDRRYACATSRRRVCRWTKWSTVFVKVTILSTGVAPRCVSFRSGPPCSPTHDTPRSPCAHVDSR